jgi:hypothetical protein
MVAATPYFRAIRRTPGSPSLQSGIASRRAPRPGPKENPMFQRTMRNLALALATVASFGASAATHEKVGECIDLSDARSFKRGGSQYLYIADGAEHYRLSFTGGDCGEMRNTSKLTLRTGDSENRICPKDTKLVANGLSCKVSGIEKLPAEDYARLTRKRRT